AGTSTSPGFYYDDTKAGSPTVTASATGMSSGIQTETVNPGPLATMTVSPAAASVSAGGTQIFTASGAGAYGNAVAPSDATWSLTSSHGGSPITGYRIYRARRPGVEGLLVSVGNVPSYTDTSTKSGVTYYYTVTALNAVGEGTASNEASATAR